MAFIYTISICRNYNGLNISVEQRGQEMMENFWGIFLEGIATLKTGR